MTTMELEAGIARWHTRRFGHVLDPIRTVLKLAEETGELAKAVLRDDHANAIEEIGDCLIVLASIARHYGVDINAAIAKKLPVLEERQRRREAKQ